MLLPRGVKYVCVHKSSYYYSESYIRPCIHPPQHHFRWGDFLPLARTINWHQHGWLLLLMLPVKVTSISGNIHLQVYSRAWLIGLILIPLYMLLLGHIISHFCQQDCLPLLLVHSGLVTMDDWTFAIRALKLWDCLRLGLQTNYLF